jgi:hypothetical protein
MTGYMQPLTPPSKSAKWAVRILVGSGVLIVAVIIAEIIFALITPWPIQPAPDRLVMITPKTVVTLAQYERLQTGMTHQQVVGILGGEGLELPRNGVGSGGEVTYRWWGAEIGAGMRATFQDGKLIQKSQSGLK